MQFHTLKPSQAYMLLQSRGATEEELLKYTFLYLVHQGILRVYRDWRYPHQDDTEQRLYVLVARGKNFTSAHPSPDEIPFLLPFARGRIEYQLSVYFKKIMHDNDGFKAYKRQEIYPTLRKEQYFHSSFGLKHLNLFLLSKKGRDSKYNLQRQLRKAERQLPKLIKSSPEEANQLLEKLGAHVLLLNCFDKELMFELKKMRYLQELSTDIASDILAEGVLSIIDSIHLPFEQLFDLSILDFGGFDFGLGDLFDFGG